MDTMFESLTVLRSDNVVSEKGIMCAPDNTLTMTFSTSNESHNDTGKLSWSWLDYNTLINHITLVLIFGVSYNMKTCYFWHFEVHFQDSEISDAWSHPRVSLKKIIVFWHECTSFVPVKRNFEIGWVLVKKSEFEVWAKSQVLTSPNQKRYLQALTNRFRMIPTACHNSAKR